MRVILANGSNSVLTPNGYTTAPNSTVLNYQIALTVTADFTVPSFQIGTIPADGQYQFVGWVSFKNGTADPPPATFVARFTYTDGAGTPTGPATFLGITGGLDQAYLVTGVPPISFVSQAGGTVEIDYGTIGFTGGSVDVVIVASVIRLA